jgi:multidrug transporter EmrE-like cation transporter
LLGATAQILMKVGAGHLGPDGLVGYFKAMPGSVLANPGLFTGYVLYGMSTLLLVLALKDGELSMLYPVIALTYVWVTAAAFLIFHDTVKPVRLVGIVIIVAGVAVLGRAGKK